MTLKSIFIASCDDHGHNEDVAEDENVRAKSQGKARAILCQLGWTFHRDGRSFCPDCNRRHVAEKANERI